MVAENRLEADLGDEEARRRAQALDALVDVAEVVLELLAGQRLDRDDCAVLLELERGRLGDRRLEPHPAIDLDAALIDERRARVDGRPGMALDDEAPDPVIGEEQGGREADQATAGDQNGDIVAAHRCRPPLGSGVMRRAASYARRHGVSWGASCAKIRERP